jgi:hypothetical protein
MVRYGRKSPVFIVLGAGQSSGGPSGDDGGGRRRVGVAVARIWGSPEREEATRAQESPI